MVDTRDILLKAAEDVTQGMWCKSAWWADKRAEDGFGIDEEGYTSEEAFADTFTTEELALRYRCAEGSIQLATVLLGGDKDDYRAAVRAVNARVPGGGLSVYNDFQLPNDSFEAGQQLAELFRTTADSL